MVITTVERILMRPKIVVIDSTLGINLLMTLKLRVLS